MNDPKFLRAPTILASFADAGSAGRRHRQDKLCLAKEHEGASAFRPKKRSRTTVAGTASTMLAFVGLPLPSVYSGNFREFVFTAGVKLMQASDRTSCISRPPTTSSTNMRRADGGR